MIDKKTHQLSNYVALILLLLTLLTGCGSAQTGNPWPSETWPVSTPEEQGIDPEAVESLVADIESGDRQAGTVAECHFGASQTLSWIVSDRQRLQTVVVTRSMVMRVRTAIEFVNVDSAIPALTLLKAAP